jgi:hypothetical protein
MKTLACVVLLFSVSTFRPTLQPRTPVDVAVAQTSRKGGRWYFADSGHAVYCYGPVMVVTQPQGGLQRVATFCRGNQTIVPLKD